MRAFRKERVPVWWTVTLHEAADGGEVKTYPFQARLLPFSTADLRSIDLGKTDLVDEIAKRVVDWSNVIDPETGESIPFSQERLREALYQSIDLMSAFRQALQEVSSGGGERKNSKPSRAH